MPGLVTPGAVVGGGLPWLGFRLIKVFGVRTKRVTILRMLFLVRKEGAPKRELGDAITVKKIRAQFGFILIIWHFWGFVLLLLYHNGWEAPS